MCIYVSFRVVCLAVRASKAFLSIATKVILLNMHSLVFSGKTVKQRFGLTIVMVVATKKHDQSWLMLNDISIVVTVAILFY